MWPQVRCCCCRSQVGYVAPKSHTNGTLIGCLFSNIRPHSHKQRTRRRPGKLVTCRVTRSASPGSRQGFPAQHIKMKTCIAISSMLWAGIVAAQGIPVTADAYSIAEMAAILADMDEYQWEKAELSAVSREIDALPQGAPVPQGLEQRRRNVTHKLQLRSYHSDEADRRLIKDLSEMVLQQPGHPWADDWKKKVADAQKRLLRDPMDSKAPLSLYR
jgi:hypothetical protein